MECNGLNPDQDRHPVDPDLGPNCFQKLSADDKVAASKERVNEEVNCFSNSYNCFGDRRFSFAHISISFAHFDSFICAQFCISFAHFVHT